MLARRSGRPMTNESPTDSLVLSYMSESHYHRCHPDDDLRPVCRPKRIRGVMAIRIQAERWGQTACPECWPGEEPVDEP
jgi:hypothetical protein